MGQEFSVNTAALGLLHGRFTFSAQTVRSMVEVVRHNPGNDKAIIQYLVTLICYQEPGPHNFKPILLHEAQTLSDSDLNNISQVILNTVPMLRNLPATGATATLRVQPYDANRFIQLAISLRAWLGEKLPNRSNLHLVVTDDAPLEVLNAVVRNANTSVTVSDLARQIAERPVARKIKTNDASARDVTDKDLMHMALAPSTQPALDELLAEARRATELQAKTAEMMVSLNDVIVTLSTRYTHDQQQAQLLARDADLEAREKDRRDFGWVRAALFATVLLGVISIAISIAALLNDHASGDEASIEAKKTRDAIQAAGATQGGELIKALQAIQDQQAVDAKRSHDQTQQLIEAVRQAPATVPNVSLPRAVGSQ
jgi:hypothetical protein